MPKFIPVMGNSEKISAASYAEGFTYFETDTGRIYVDTNGERKIFGGGGVEIFYASSTNITESFYDESFNIPFVDLENEEAQLSPDDLIINSDGRFFKVIEFDSDSGLINCSLIAVSGTGGGSGGDDPGGDTPSTSTIKLEAINAVRGPYVFGQPANIVYKATATEDYNVTYTITISLNDGTSKNIQRSAESGKEFSFDLGSELYKGLNKVVVAVSGDNSGSTSRTYRNINCIEMALRESANFNPLEVFDGELIFTCIPVGAGLTKTLRYYIDNEIQNNLTQTVTSSEQDVRVSIVGLSHGTHSIKAVLSTGEGTTEVSAAPLQYEIAYAEEGNESPII